MGLRPGTRRDFLVRFPQGDIRVLYDTVKDFEDAIARVKDLIQQAKRLEKVYGSIDENEMKRREVRIQWVEEQDIEKLLQDLIFGFRNLIFYLSQQIKLEKIEGRSKVYAVFKPKIEQELAFLISELQKLRVQFAET